ncbi:MAG: hypothetical protein ABIE68_00825 [bacterium]
MRKAGKDYPICSSCTNFISRITKFKPLSGTNLIRRILWVIVLGFFFYLAKTANIPYTSTTSGIIIFGILILCLTCEYYLRNFTHSIGHIQNDNGGITHIHSTPPCSAKNNDVKYPNTVFTDQQLTVIIAFDGTANNRKKNSCILGHKIDTDNSSYIYFSSIWEVLGGFVNNNIPPEYLNICFCESGLVSNLLAVIKLKGTGKKFIFSAEKIPHIIANCRSSKEVTDFIGQRFHSDRAWI